MHTMQGFQTREQAHENLFAHDEELRFRLRAHAARLFLEWIGQELNRDIGEKEALKERAAKCVCETDGLQKLEHMAHDQFAQAEQECSRHRLEQQWDACYIRALKDFGLDAEIAS